MHSKLVLWSGWQNRQFMKLASNTSAVESYSKEECDGCLLDCWVLAQDDVTGEYDSVSLL